MLRLDPATTSGSAVAFLFRKWCFLRDAGPGRRPERLNWPTPWRTWPSASAWIRPAPHAQVELAGTGEVFTVFGLRYDRADALLMAGVIPGEHAAAVVELDGDELDFSRWPTPSALSPGTQPPGPRGCRSIAGTVGCPTPDRCLFVLRCVM
ncbi:hypothetical protein ADL00_29815 [Streptomyces sp. AS58]|uniref:hypothetical protein n=1 Tax=Streptomyces sp. AS58 TaxID=1519489 RepID=UPI0006AE7982|nr:hypothetical protein [Streptomyces sp. AS58]KOV54582.1 hypothetical protein ADL00_29815 [Streptomyces sp. AS58]